MILQSNLLLTELSIIYIESRMQNLPFFVGEWALLRYWCSALPTELTYGPEFFFQVLFSTTRFSRVLSCEDLFILFRHCSANV